jgi:branched-chain amino acid transport system substrate-binding protein
MVLVCASLVVVSLLLPAVQPQYPVLAATPIKIGVIEDTSGAASYYSQESVKGIQLAIAELNAKGGVGDHPLETVLEDDQNKPPLSAEKLRKLASDKDIVAILTVSGSADALQNQKVAEEEKIPEIAPTNIVDALTKTPLKYFFRISPSDSDYLAFTMTTTAKKYKKVAIFTDNTQTGVAEANSYVDGLKKRGVDVVSVERVDTGATDATPQILHMKNAGAELVLLVAQGVPELALAARTIRSINWNVPILGTDTVGVPSFVALAKSAANGVLFTDIIDDTKPAFQALAKRWTARYGAKSDISTNAVESYDAVYILAEAIAKGGGASREQIRSGLEQTSRYEAVSGRNGSYVRFSPLSHQGMGPESVTIRIYKNLRPSAYTGY